MTGKAWSGHPDYPLRYEWPEEDAQPPEMPPMTAVFEFAPDAFVTEPRRPWWRRLLGWRR